jgi:hypothetical protein
VGLFTTTYRLRWTAPAGDLRDLARELHQRIRQGVLGQVERGEAVLLVSQGVASPPGPVRLLLEDRRKGMPGRVFRAVLARDGAQVELAVRTSRLRPLPLDLLAPVLAAVQAVAAPQRPAWTVG